MFSAVVNFFFIPYYPFWSLLVIALDVWVIWALTRPGAIETFEAQWLDPAAAAVRPDRPFARWTITPPHDASNLLVPVRTLLKLAVFGALVVLVIVALDVFCRFFVAVVLAHRAWTRSSARSSGVAGRAGGPRSRCSRRSSYPWR